MGHQIVSVEDVVGSNRPLSSFSSFLTRAPAGGVKFLGTLGKAVQAAGKPILAARIGQGTEALGGLFAFQDAMAVAESGYDVAQSAWKDGITVGLVGQVKGFFQNCFDLVDDGSDATLFAKSVGLLKAGSEEIIGQVGKVACIFSGFIGLSDAIAFLVKNDSSGLSKRAKEVYNKLWTKNLWAYGENIFKIACAVTVVVGITTAHMWLFALSLGYLLTSVGHYLAGRDVQQFCVEQGLQKI